MNAPQRPQSRPPSPDAPIRAEYLADDGDTESPFDAAGTGAPGAHNVVTASTLVRHFGIWQERAIHEPVYILHRGRPRFVLSTIEIMQALCAPHQSEQGNLADRTAFETLLELTTETILFCDKSLNIVAASAPARRYLGQSPSADTSFADIAGGPGLEVAKAAILRVAASGHGEDVDISPTRYPGRRLRLSLEPHPLGVAMIARDETMREELQAARSISLAQEDAAAALGCMANVRIGLRGYLETAPLSLCQLTGLSSDALLGTRFVSLLDIAGRALAGDAIESAICDGDSNALTTSLLVNRGSALPIRLGLAPVRQGGVVISVQATMVALAGLEGLKPA